MKPFSVFLSYAYNPRQQAYTRANILALVEKACETVKNDLKSELPHLEFIITAELEEYGGRLNDEILVKLESADISIVDISDNNPNVFYELGALHILGKKPILLKSLKIEKEFPIPADIVGTMLLKYQNISDIEGRLALALTNEVVKQFKRKQRIPLQMCRDFWGERDKAQSSHVLIAPRSSVKTVFSEINSPNYIYLDRLGDKDAIVELSVLLARLYPYTPIVRYISDEVPRDAYENDIVTIGGPGHTNVEGAMNILVLPLHKKLKIKAHYTDDCEKLLLDDNEMLEATVIKGKLVQDIGFFAKAKNPYNPARSVIIVHGIHTYGVLGAARCFSDHPKAIENIASVLDLLGSDPSFWTYFEVDIVEGTAMVPQIRADRIFEIKE